MGKNTLAVFAFIAFAAVAFAQGSLESALAGFCLQLYSYVGDLAFIMMLLSSVVFAAGQLFGSEARARANVWANSMFIGAIIGLLMVILVPWFLGLLLGGGMSFSADTCTFS